MPARRKKKRQTIIGAYEQNTREMARVTHRLDLIEQRARQLETMVSRIAVPPKLTLTPKERNLLLEHTREGDHELLESILERHGIDPSEGR